MKKKIVSCILCAAATISLVSGCGSNKETETDKKEAHAEKSVQSEDRNYEPVTIQLNLERSGLGKNVEYTFKQNRIMWLLPEIRWQICFLIWA